MAPKWARAACDVAAGSKVRKGRQMGKMLKTGTLGRFLSETRRKRGRGDLVKPEPTLTDRTPHLHIRVSPPFLCARQRCNQEIRVADKPIVRQGGCACQGGNACEFFPITK